MEQESDISQRSGHQAAGVKLRGQGSVAGIRSQHESGGRETGQETVEKAKPERQGLVEPVAGSMRKGDEE